MWNSVKSVNLSIVCTRIVMVLVCICVAVYTFAPESIFGYSAVYSGEIPPLFGLRFYFCCAVAFVALFLLGKLLANIKREEIFIVDNVKILRSMSWCCFLVAIVLATIWIYYIFLPMAAMAAFIGLILRVVKNVFEAAVELKAENDYTI